jgi:hypothetical protein
MTIGTISRLWIRQYIEIACAMITENKEVDMVPHVPTISRALRCVRIFQELLVLRLN